MSKVIIYFVPLLTDVAVSLPEARENMDSSPEIKTEPVVGALPVFEYSAAQDMWNEPQKERHKKFKKFKKPEMTIKAMNSLLKI